MILLTGGSGLLGQELQKIFKRDGVDFSAPLKIWNGKPYLDITDSELKGFWWEPDFHLIVHCAAYTDVVKAETEKELCYQTNVIGTRNLASLGIPMLYISTEYVFDGEEGNYDENDYPNPQNFYALTKLLGEYESRRTKSVVARLLFKPRPFEHTAACVDMFTSGDYVDRIAQELVIAIKKFDHLPPTLHIGTGRKSIFELSRQTRITAPINREEIKMVRLPKDTSLNTTLWERIKNELF